MTVLYSRVRIQGMLWRCGVPIFYQVELPLPVMKNKKYRRGEEISPNEIQESDPLQMIIIKFLLLTNQLCEVKWSVFCNRTPQDFQKKTNSYSTNNLGRKIQPNNVLSVKITTTSKYKLNIRNLWINLNRLILSSRTRLIQIQHQLWRRYEQFSNSFLYFSILWSQPVPN